MSKEPRTLLEAIKHFADPDVALAQMVELRWPNGVHCPSCGRAIETQSYAAAEIRPMRDIWKNDDCIEVFQYGTDPQATQTWWRPTTYLPTYSTGYESSPVTEASLFVFTHALDYVGFNKLVDQWHVERGATSSITKMALSVAYQRIIGMGERAIPLILRRMENEGQQPDMWFWALQSITGVDPVPAEARGNMPEMAQTWLNWARGKYAW